ASTKFELVINFNTAKALGLTIPGHAARALLTPECAPDRGLTNLIIDSKLAHGFARQRSVRQFSCADQRRARTARKIPAPRGIVRAATQSLCPEKPMATRLGGLAALMEIIEAREFSRKSTRPNAVKRDVVFDAAYRPTRLKRFVHF